MMQRLSSVGVTRELLPSAEEASEQKATLFRKASDAIKEVQRRFHGKHEIATASDSSVSCLCTTLETIMLHGLKPPRKRGGEHAFWPLVSSILTEEDASAMSMLRNIRTDSGKGRAWLRWALNERSLEKYFNLLTEPLVFASGLYYDFAFLCDEDQMSMLTMLVVGIETIVFAIEVDSATLDKVNEYNPAVSQPKPAPAKPVYDATPAATFNPPVDDMDPMDLVVAVKKSKKSKSKKKKRHDRTPSIGAINDDLNQAQNNPMPLQASSALDIPEAGSNQFSGYPNRSSMDASYLPSSSVLGSIGNDSGFSNDMGASSVATFSIPPDIEAVAQQSSDADWQATPSYGHSREPSIASVGTSAASGDSFPQALSTESAFNAIDAMLANSGSADTGIDMPDSNPGSARSPSPATIARMALEASRNPSATASRKQSPTTSPSGLNQDDLRSTLVGVIRQKEDLEQAFDKVKDELSQAKLSVTKLEEEKLAATLRLEELEQRVELSGDDRSTAEQMMAKENSLLKQQLKKYVAENQQLKRSHKELLDGKELNMPQLAMALAESQAEPSGLGLRPPANSFSSMNAPDMIKPEDVAMKLQSAAADKEIDESVGDYASIEDMQAHHERQILQLTEMHCELIDMNERLQSQLTQRDSQVRQLGGIVPADSGQMGGRDRHNTLTPSGPKPARLPPPPEGSLTVPGRNTIVNVWIPSALLRGKGSESYHVYQIYIRVGDEEWNVYRRFTHFVDLHRQVQHIFTTKLAFPQKKVFNRRGSKFVEDRRQALEAYVRKVVEMCLSQRRSPMVVNPCKQTFCEALPFLKEKLSGVAALAKPRAQSTYGDL